MDVEHEKLALVAQDIHKIALDGSKASSGSTLDSPNGTVSRDRISRDQTVLPLPFLAFLSLTETPQNYSIASSVQSSELPRAIALNSSRFLVGDC
jgi:hypothetical protein